MQNLHTPSHDAVATHFICFLVGNQIEFLQGWFSFFSNDALAPDLPGSAAYCELANDVITKGKVLECILQQGAKLG